jgi:hypothetical protein
MENRKIRVQFPAETGIFLFTTMSRVALEHHPNSYPVNSGGYFYWDKAAGM